MRRGSARLPTGDDMGGEVARSFERRVLLLQAFVGVVAFFIVNLLAPWALMLHAQRLSELWLAGLEAGVFAVGLTALLSAHRLRQSRAVFLMLALEPERVEPHDVGTLVTLPQSLSTRFVIAGSLAASAMVVPGVRPPELDQARAVSLMLLTATMVVAAALVHQVVIRDLTLRLVELSPPGPITSWLEREAVRLVPRRLVTRRILIAVVVPVVLVGVGAVLIAQAHLRAFVERSRADTARQLAQTAVDPIAGAVGDAGRSDAVAAAAAHGFFVSYQRGPRPAADGLTEPWRTGTGQLVVRTALEDGSASVRYSAELSAAVVTTGVWVALLAVAIAVLFGLAFGSMLASDLVLATERVARLGAEHVLRGEARVAGRARFRVVAQLGRSVEALAERFREFAAAQERALEAKAAGQRTRQLLFASMSHDLKGPLNAVLGFAELVREEPLTDQQRENLEMVSGRGRELLVLIETILDAARVEAGQLRLRPQAVLPEDLLGNAVRKARDLTGQHRVHVVMEIDPAMPALWVDPVHAGRAVAVLIAHALETAVDAPARAIRVRGALPMRADRAGRQPAAAHFHVEFVAARSRPSLLHAELEGTLQPTGNRGMALRLSLARSIIELHGGRVEVGRGPHGAAVVSCALPTVAGGAGGGGPSQQ